jgi:two-component system response regulator HydG
MSSRILIVDDDRVFRLSTAALLRAEGYRVDEAADAEAALVRLRQQSFQLMLLDYRMPGLDGVRFVEAMRLWGERVPVLMISGFGTIDTAVHALHNGADDYLQKPFEPDALLARVDELLTRHPPADAPPVADHGIVGRSTAIQEVIEAIARVGPTDATTLITGETGTGKELVARAVHRASARSRAPFVAVNCAALAEGLLESELFGHVRGAFTGALRDRTGLFEAASGGTLLLDEVGEMSLATQQRLLRVLQERELTRVGDTRVTRVDVRVIAATNRDLRRLIAERRFREDLFYRLSVFPIDVAPLRERKEDLPLLVADGLSRLTERLGRPTRLECSPFALRVMRSYAWPGNVRELYSALEQAAINAGFGRIEAQHLPEAVRDEAAERRERYRAPRGDDEERAAILAALEHSGGTLSRAAQLLGMGRTTLWRKMRALGLEPPLEPGNPGRVTPSEPGQGTG